MSRSTPIAPLDAPLTDGVVLVRRRRRSDLDAIAAASHDPETLRWLTDPAMDAQARRTSMATVAEAWRSGRSAPLVVADAASDHPVGLVNVQFRSDAVATVAYSVFPEFRGRGFAARAVRLVAGWAVEDLGVVELHLEADEANVASTRVADACGFERVGTRIDEAPDGGSRTTAVFRRPASGP